MWWVVVGLGGPAVGIFWAMQHFWGVTTNQWGAIGLAGTLGAVCYAGFANYALPAVLAAAANDQHPGDDDF
jgi:hypothetical protein